MRLAFLSLGLGALGLAALIAVAMGTYRPQKDILIQEIADQKHIAPPPLDEKARR